MVYPRQLYTIKLMPTNKDQLRFYPYLSTCPAMMSSLCESELCFTVHTCWCLCVWDPLGGYFTQGGAVWGRGTRIEPRGLAWYGRSFSAPNCTGHLFICKFKFCKCYVLLLHFAYQQQSYEPRREKTGLRGFRPGLTRTSLYSHRSRLEA